MPPENDPSNQGSPDTTNAGAPDGAPQTPDFGAIANQAATAQLKRFAEKQLPTVLEGFMKPYLEKLEKLSVAPQQSDPKESKKSPEFAALEQKLAEVEKRAAEADSRRASAEKKQREDRAFSELKGALSGKVLPEFLDMVSSHLFQVQRVVDTNDEGESVFNFTKKSQYGDEELRLPIKDGVEQWLRSESAKPFVPAPGTSGASQKPRGNTAPSINPQFDPAKASAEEKILHAMATSALHENKFR